MSIAERFITHRVENQVPVLGPYDAWLTDSALREAVQREGGGWAEAALADFGGLAGGELMELGFAANENKPRLRAFDRTGERIDEVDFHPSYHRADAARHAARRARVRLAATRHGRARTSRARRSSSCTTRPSSGTCCPLTMTHAVRAGAAAQRRARRRSGCRASPRSTTTRAACRRTQKRGCTIGMGMTEKQGGSDVRANTHARRRPGRRQPTRSSATSGSSPRRCAMPGWCSRRRDAGLTCFLLPRWRPDGTRNAIRMQRLKDKLGDWSNASSEVEFQGARARARRRRGPRRRDHPRDGGADAARLHDRLGRPDAPGDWCRRCTTRAIATPSAGAWSSSR